MRYWKVYARCVRKAVPIEELYDESEVIQAAMPLIDHWMEWYDGDYPENEFDRLLEHASDKLTVKGILEVGDYAIIRSMDVPERADCYGWEVR